jgi:hypothetical protein
MSKRSSKGDRILAILGYHKIDEPPGWVENGYYMPEESFIVQLNYLRENG